MRRKVPTDRLEGLIESESGLTTADAASRRELYGWNDIVEAPPGTWRELARDTLRDPMLWFLLGTAVLFAVLGDFVEAITLFCAIVPLDRHGRVPSSSYAGIDARTCEQTRDNRKSHAGRRVG